MGTRQPAVIAFLLYLLIGCVMTYPLIFNLSTRLAGFEHSDAYEMAHHIWWFTHAVKTGEPMFYQTMMAYPDGLDGVTLWANPLQFFPAWLLALIVGVPAAYNGTILLTLAFNGLAAYLLISYLLNRATGLSYTQRSALSPQSFLAPFVGGVVFMLYPTMQGHLGAGHAGLLVQWTLALYAWVLLRLDQDHIPNARTPRMASLRAILIAAALFVMSAWGHTLQILYATLPVTAVILLAWLIRRHWSAVRRALIALVIGSIALGIFLIPVARATFGTAAYANEGGFVRYSADLLAPVTPSFFHPLYGTLAYTHRVLGVNLDEGAAYIGIAAGALALISIVRRREARLWLVLAGLAFVLSLGPLLKILDQPLTFTTDGYTSGVTLPFAYLANLPLINLARTPGRFNFMLALAVAVMTGYGVSVIWTQRRKDAKGNGGWVVTRYAAAGVIVALIAFDYQTFFPLPTISAAIPNGIQGLASRDDLRAVFDVPYDNLVTAKSGLYLQTAHQHPLIAGQVTRRTPVNPAKLAILESTLDPALLRSVGADVVIVHREQDGGTLEARARDQLGDPLFSDEQYAVFETPAANATAVDFTVLADLSKPLTDSVPLYVYAPQPVGALLTVGLSADRRDIGAALDDQPEPLGRWSINGSAEVTVFIGFDAGFHTVTLSIDPPCPLLLDESLQCRGVQIEHLTLEPKP